MKRPSAGRSRTTAIAAWRLLVFPYALRYDVAADGNIDIDIVAVAHAKRAPGYFRGRTK